MTNGLQEVSILTLLDSLLLFNVLKIIVEDLERFNPYSTGFSSFIQKIIWDSMQLMRVSILILLDSLLLSETKTGTGETSLYAFQSLFYWILFFYHRSKSHWEVLLRVSILILLDSLLLSVLQSRLFIFNSYRVFLRI